MSMHSKPWHMLQDNHYHLCWLFFCQDPIFIKCYLMIGVTIRKMLFLSQLCEMYIIKNLLPCSPQRGIFPLKLFHLYYYMAIFNYFIDISKYISKILGNCFVLFSTIHNGNFMGPGEKEFFTAVNIHPHSSESTENLDACFKLILKLPLGDRILSVSCRMPKLKRTKLVRRVIQAPLPLNFILTVSSGFNAPVAL